MNTRISSTRALAVAAMAGAVLLLSGCGRSDRSQDKQHIPAALSQQIVLKPAKAGEKIRYVDFAPDHVTKLDARVEYTDGTTALITYRHDQTIASATVLYPLGEKQTKRQVARELTFDKDGKTYVSETSFRPDGTVSHRGSRTGAATYEAFAYQADGTTVARHQSFSMIDNAWKIALDASFRADGTQDSLGKLLADKSFETDAFGADGTTVISKALMNSTETELDTQYFWPGTTVLRKKTIQQGYQVVVETYRQNGVIAERRTFGYQFSSMTVDVFDAKGVLSFEQLWAAIPATAGATASADSAKPKPQEQQYRLTEVKQMRADGNVATDIDFNIDGKTIRREVQTAPGSTNVWSARTVRSYAHDGTLELVEQYDAKNNLVKSEKHTPADGLRPHVAPALTASRPYDSPPDMLKTSSPFMIFDF